MAGPAAKLRNLSVEDLDKEELELRQEIWKLRVQTATGQVQGPHKLREARRGLARVLTVRREREPSAPRGR